LIPSNERLYFVLIFLLRRSKNALNIYIYIYKHCIIGASIRSIFALFILVRLLCCCLPPRETCQNTESCVRFGCNKKIFDFPFDYNIQVDSQIIQTCEIRFNCTFTVGRVTADHTGTLPIDWIRFSGLINYPRSRASKLCSLPNESWDTNRIQLLFEIKCCGKYIMMYYFCRLLSMRDNFYYDKLFNRLGVCRGAYKGFWEFANNKSLPRCGQQQYVIRNK